MAKSSSGKPQPNGGAATRTPDSGQGKGTRPVPAGTVRPPTGY